MDTASTRKHKFTALKAKPTPLSTKSPAAPSPNHPQKRATSWRRSQAPVDDRRRTPSVLLLGLPFFQTTTDLDITKTGPV